MQININAASFIFAIFMPLSAIANSTLNTADELHQHLIKGCDVRAIVDTHFCQNSTPYGDGIYRIDFSMFNIYEIPQDGEMKQIIAASMTTSTNHRKYGPVLGYSRLRVSYDNSVEAFSETIDIKTGKSLESYTVNCHINKGVKLISSCEDAP